MPVTGLEVDICAISTIYEEDDVWDDSREGGISKQKTSTQYTRKERINRPKLLNEKGTLLAAWSSGLGLRFAAAESDVTEKFGISRP